LGAEIKKIINSHVINTDWGPRLLKEDPSSHLLSADSNFFFTDPNFRVELDMNMNMNMNMNMDMDMNMNMNMNMNMDMDVNMNMNNLCIKS
jgi:hypothetical protein